MKSLIWKYFLAHEDIKVSKTWEDKILEELNDCDMFIGLITKAFMASEWTYLEAGNAIGQNKKIILIMHGGELKGFLKRYQYVQYSRRKDKPYINKIIDSILEDTALRDRFISYVPQLPDVK